MKSTAACEPLLSATASPTKLPPAAPPATANSSVSRRLLRHELERRVPRVGGHHRVDVGAAEAAVLGPVCGVDQVVDGGVGFLGESDVLVDAAGLDVTLMTGQGTAEPGTAV